MKRFRSFLILPQMKIQLFLFFKWKIQLFNCAYSCIYWHPQFRELFHNLYMVHNKQTFSQIIISHIRYIHSPSHIIWTPHWMGHMLWEGESIYPIHKIPSLPTCKFTWNASVPSAHKHWNIYAHNPTITERERESKHNQFHWIKIS